MLPPSSSQAHQDGYQTAFEQANKMVPTQVQALLEDKLAVVEAAHAAHVQAAVDEASAKLKRAPIRDAPCAEERSQVAACYKASTTALKCQDVVAAYTACSKAASAHLLENR